MIITIIPRYVLCRSDDRLMVMSLYVCIVCACVVNTYHDLEHSNIYNFIAINLERFDAQYKISMILLLLSIIDI